MVAKFSLEVGRLVHRMVENRLREQAHLLNVSLYIRTLSGFLDVTMLCTVEGDRKAVRDFKQFVQSLLDLEP